MNSREASLDEVSAALDAAQASGALQAMRAEALAAFEQGERIQRGKAVAWRIAAGVVVFVLGAAAYRFMFSPPTSVDANLFATALGERRIIRLADNSAVTLNTDSELHVSFTGLERRVELRRGQALFDVARDSGRPFVVFAGEGVVRALGTQFDVRRREQDIVVTLIEGRVRVETADADVRTAAELAPGERVQVSAKGVSRIRPVDTSKSSAWTDGHLIFENEPLESAADEVNRYSRVRVRLGDPRLRGIRVSGVFRTGSSAGFVEALEASYPVRATLLGGGGEVVLSPR
jgi:transmembrane sensor